MSKSDSDYSSLHSVPADSDAAPLATEPAPLNAGSSGRDLPPPPASSDGAEGPLPTIGHIGRYALKYKIGEGGLGSVFAAHDPLLSRLIAIKTLNLDIPDDQRAAFNALFLNEARSAAGLSHPNIVTVFDAGLSDSKAYIAMELLKGKDLRQLRKEGWRPSNMQAALIVRRVADALAYAHSKGVVHCDIKPANIFMLSRTQPRVLDFGIARATHRHDSHTDADLIGGSPYYMAPEQVRQHAIDRRVDVFSLGVVLYELLTDQKPFRGNTLDEITAAVLEHRPPLAHTINPEVHPSLSEIAAKAMEKLPDNRFRSARALSKVLRLWLEEHGHEGDVGADALTARQPPPTRWRWIAATAGSLAVAGVAGWALLGSSPKQVEPAPVVAMPPAASAVTPPPPVATVAAQPSDPQLVLAEPSSTLLDASMAQGETVVVSDAASAAVGNTSSSGPVASSTTPSRPAVADSARETPRERRTREAREAREKRARDAAEKPSGTLFTGTVRLAVSPWGQVEVNGRPMGTAPPLNELSLPEGRHQIVIRNGDSPPYSASINVTPGQPVTIKHRFGS